jgi:hypothetical protein
MQYLPPYVTPSPFGPNIIQTTLFSNTAEGARSPPCDTNL